MFTFIDTWQAKSWISLNAPVLRRYFIEKLQNAIDDAAGEDAHLIKVSPIAAAGFCAWSIQFAITHAGFSEDICKRLLTHTDHCFRSTSHDRWFNAELGEYLTSSSAEQIDTEIADHFGLNEQYWEKLRSANMRSTQATEIATASHGVYFPERVPTIAAMTTAALVNADLTDAFVGKRGLLIDPTFPAEKTSIVLIFIRGPVGWVFRHALAGLKDNSAVDVSAGY